MRKSGLTCKVVMAFWINIYGCQPYHRLGKLYQGYFIAFYLGNFNYPLRQKNHICTYYFKSYLQKLSSSSGRTQKGSEIKR